MFRRFRRLCLVVPIVAGLAATAALGASCSSGGSGGGSDVESTLKHAIDAWNGKDVEGFLALVSDNFLSNELGFASRYEAQQGLATGIGTPKLSLGDLSDTLITGDSAATSAPFYFGQMGSRDAFSFVKVGDQWQLDSDDPARGDVPEGTKSVSLSMSEYKFDFDHSAVAGGDFGFAASNTGSEQHELALVKVPDDLSIDDLLSAQSLPDGVKEIGFAGPFDPGSSTPILFKDSLASGRYVMLCFIAAPDGEDHAHKGQVEEFTVAD